MLFFTPLCLLPPTVYIFSPSLHFLPHHSHFFPSTSRFLPSISSLKPLPSAPPFISHAASFHASLSSALLYLCLAVLLSCLPSLFRLAFLCTFFFAFPPFPHLPRLLGFPTQLFESFFDAWNQQAACCSFARSYKSEELKGHDECDSPTSGHAMIVVIVSVYPPGSEFKAHMSHV